MDGRKGTGVEINEMVASAEDRQRDTERAAQLLNEAEEDLGVVVQDIPLDAIEPDPLQPRRVFDEEKLQSLAVSIGKYGLLQEPGVVAIAMDAAGLPTRFRIIWGERRLRACRIAGLRLLRCKVLPRGDDTAAEQLRTKEKQWAENAEREGLSPVEEAISIQDAVDVARKVNPETPVGELVEKVGAQRGFNGMVARNLVALLKAPQCLQTAMMGRGIGREVGFELSRHWNRLLEQHELHGSMKRDPVPQPGGGLGDGARTGAERGVDGEVRGGDVSGSEGRESGLPQGRGVPESCPGALQGAGRARPEA